MSESVKKGKFVTEVFFQIMLNEVLNICEKSADVKANVKQNEIKLKELVAVSSYAVSIFIKSTPSKLEIQCKK